MRLPKDSASQLLEFMFHEYINCHPSFQELEMTLVQSFSDALVSVGITPKQVDVVIQTYLHFDHCYTLKRGVNAEVFVQRDEYSQAMDPAPHQRIYRRELWEGSNLHLIEREHQLEPGLSLLPVLGHTGGGQAVLLNIVRGQ